MAAPAFGPAWLQRQLTDLGVPARGAQLCIAFSGGLDSSALLHALAQLRSAKPARFALRALHIDHQLQPASAQWAAQARVVARQQRVPLEVITVRVDSRGRSVEAAARDARYAALTGALHAGEFLLTAQHLDDQLETVLLQLLRGAGVAGLAAMPARANLARGVLLRPLLPVSRAALRAYVETQRLTWCEDDSNADPRFDRNFLRQQVLPSLLQRWPAAAQTVARSASLMAEAQELLAVTAERDWRTAVDGAALRVSALRALSPAARANLLRYWLRQRGLPLPDQARLRELAGPLLAARGDSQPHIRWPGAEVHRFDGRLHAFTGLMPAPTGSIDWSWLRRRTLFVPGAGILRLREDPHGALDLSRLPRRLQLGFRGGGERLAGERGHRTLKEWLRTQRLAPWERARLPLIYADGRLIAVADRWCSPALAATAASRRRARLEWIWSYEAPTVTAETI
jgi:tRNA(Ile)-lysidine synthase